MDEQQQESTFTGFEGLTRDKPLSLETLTDDEKKKILKVFKRGRDSADEYYNDTIEPAIIKRKELYEAPIQLYKKKFPKLSELSDWISKDIKTTIDWVIPALMDVFSGTDDPCDIQGQNVEDDITAKKLQQVINYQINKKNNCFSFLINYLREGLITNMGVAKVYWRRDEKRQPMEVMIDQTNAQEYIQKAMLGLIEIREIEPISDIGGILRYDEIDIKFNAPVIENISPSELRFTPDGKDLQNVSFVAHRKIVKGDYLKRKEKEGLFVDVDKAIDNAGNTQWTTLDQKNNQWLQTNRRNDDGDRASKDVELYEAYINVDYNNDGILENLIVHAVGDVLLSVQENSFCEVPLFLWSPEIDPYTPFSKFSFADNLEQLQDLKTALVRQVIIAVGKNNRPQRFVNEDNVNMDALIDGDEIVGVRGDSPANSVMISPHIQLDQSTMSLVQYAQSEIESQSGSTKYNQGLDSSSLNKSATGISMIMGAADKRMKLLAQQFASNSWVPIIKHIIKLNQNFLVPYQQIRINNDMVNLEPNEFDIDFDLTVNTGQGAATKEAQMNYLIMILQQLYPTLQQIGIVNATSWYESAKDLLEKMGIRNIQTYLVDPRSQEYQQAQQQQAQAQQQQQQAVMQAQMALEKAKLDAQLQRQSIPKFNINYKDLPVSAKQEAIEKAYSVSAPTEEIIQKEMWDLQKGGR